ncbi:MAG: hypothetical protein JKY16_04780 [Lutibacter sp.]|nr:hypothetical protein [Lutibacter sp.]
MKKYLFIITFSLILVSCGGGSGDDPIPTPEPENKAPSTPTLSAPTNGKLCIDNSVSFQWSNSIDPDGDTVSYQIQVAKDNQFNQITHTLSGSATNQSISLERGIAYYWRVKATDSKNLSSSYSSTFNFYTEGEGESNHLPFSPEIVQPALNSIVQTATATLEWTANDVDTNDNLTFDVFFGAVNPPTEKMGDNQTASTLSVDVDSSTNYYWKVVVKDNNGGTTTGQIWYFNTD